MTEGAELKAKLSDYLTDIIFTGWVLGFDWNT